MFKTSTIRTVFVALAAVVVFGLAATSALALTAAQKDSNFHGCIQAGGSMKACCIGAGGVYRSGTDSTGDPWESCSFSDDKISSGASLRGAALAGATYTSTTGATSTTTSPLASSGTAISSSG